MTEQQQKEPRMAILSPLGLMGVGICCLTIMALLTGLVPPEGTLIAATWIFFSGMALFPSGIYMAVRGDFVIGTLQSIFGVFFTTAWGATTFVQVFASQYLGFQVSCWQNGFVSILLGIITIAYTPWAARSSVVALIGMLAFDISLIGIGVAIVFGIASLLPFMGLIVGIGGATYFYLGLSMIVSLSK